MGAKVLAALRWMRDKFLQAHSEDDDGKVLSSTRLTATGYYVLTAIFVVGTVAYVFVCVLVKDQKPDYLVVGALVGGITALGGTGYGTNKNRV